MCPLRGILGLMADGNAGKFVCGEEAENQRQRKGYSILCKRNYNHEEVESCQYCSFFGIQGQDLSICDDHVFR